MEEQKDTKANVLEEAAMMESSNKLRILLTEPPSDNRDRILKELLNRKDDDTGKNDNRQSPRGLMSRPSMPGPSEPPKSTNNMLLQVRIFLITVETHVFKSGERAGYLKIFFMIRLLRKGVLNNNIRETQYW